MKFTDAVPDTVGASIVGVTVDNFRQLARKPGFPKSEKIGYMNFRSKRELLAWKRERDAKRAAKA